MFENFLRYVYTKRKVLLNIIPVGFIILAVLSFYWFLTPENSKMEPLIVFLGFLITIIQLLPTAILNVYPTVKYKFKLEPKFAGLVKESNVKYIASVKDLNDSAINKLDSVSVWLSVTNMSEEKVGIKFIEFNIDNKEIKTFGVGPLLSPGDKPYKTIYPEDSELFCLDAFVSIISQSHYPVVVLENGLKIKYSSSITKNLIKEMKTLEKWKEANKSLERNI